MTCCSDRDSGDKVSGVPVVAHVAWAAGFGQELYYPLHGFGSERNIPQRALRGYGHYSLLCLGFWAQDLRCTNTSRGFPRMDRRVQLTLPLETTRLCPSACVTVALSG